jgi:hypothetical protein
MKPMMLQATSAVVCVALLTSACENLSPGENAALFGTAAGLAVGIPLAAAGVDPSIVIPVTAGAVAVAGIGAYVIAKHQATERQRKIAEQRARTYLAKRAQQAKAQTASASSSSAPSKPKPAKKPRYIAVKTEKENFNKGQAAVMIFDTQSNQIVGNNVYDVKSTPKVGSTSKFDTYTAEYVGAGS